MPGLNLYLFGPPRLERAGTPLDLGRRKARALLAYLAVTRQSHSREALATLFWPEYDQHRGRANLSRTLYVLKKALGAGCLVADRETVELNLEAGSSTGSGQALWVDTAHFQQLLATCRTHGHPESMVCAACLLLMAEAAALYQADFLAGFTLPGSSGWDEWQLFQAEGLRRDLVGALERLGWGYSGQGKWEKAIQYSLRWVGLEPLHELAHRQLMLLYARSDQRAAALAQYEICHRLLKEELGVEPAEETRSLCQQIQAGTLRFFVPPPVRSLSVPAQPPAFLADEQATSAAVSECAVFVARERELAQLDEHLNAALAGQGRIVFVTGEAGYGKTALLAEFARRAQEAQAELIVAGGNCNAYSGVGDPYLPFRDVMGMLGGEVESKWVAGMITREHACRLWALLPHTIRALVEAGPDLIDVFVSGAAWRRGAAACTPGETSWLKALKELTERERAGLNDLEQRQLFEQYTQVLHVLAARQPLLLLLDDLQWADGASINLLFHLGRRLPGSRILILGAYRPSEVALGRLSADSRTAIMHPLKPVVNEFTRLFGDIQLNLGQIAPAEGQGFVDALLNAEPNRLGEDFRQALFRHTRGHPLFTVELLRDMQERGGLIQDEEGHWIEGPAIAWDALPARVEAVIEGRMSRLEETLRDILTVASVEGEDFTVQVVAHVQGISERVLLRQLSQELEKRHGLVRERGEMKVGYQRLSRYQFAHVLGQQYLYNRLSLGERRLLHGEIAQVLEALYEERTDEIVVQLAHHYAEAEEREKAIDYLLQAGDQSRGLYAYREAIDHYQRALVFLKEQGDSARERAARTLMKLGLAYHIAFDFQRARQAYEDGFVLWQRAGETHPVTPSLPAPHPLKVDWRDPPTLDPTVAEDFWSVSLIGQLFSGLVELSPEMDVVPDVARTWEVLDGGRKYIFHLRDDVCWSDGTPVTAGDFEYAWKRVLDSATRSPLVGFLYDIKGARAFHRGDLSDPDQVAVRALDEVTLVVELEGPTGYFPHLLAYTSTYPIPRHLVEVHGEAWAEVGNIVTNGPFKLETWQRGELMALARNPAYHGRFIGNAHQIELSLRADLSTILEMYEADELDIFHLGSLPPPEMDCARQQHAEEYVSGPLLFTLYLGFDVSQPPFDDPRVRRAFVLATDRETLADVILRGYYFPATGGLVPPGMPGHSPGIGLPFEPVQARQLLAEAGYLNGDRRGFPVVDWLVHHGRVYESEYLRAQWEKHLGVEVRCETMELAELYDRLDKARPHAFLIGWVAEYPDPDSFLRVCVQGSRIEWRDESYDRLVQKARRVTDQGERMKLYRQADRVLVEEAAIMPIAYGRVHLLVKPWVKRYLISPIIGQFWKDVVIEPH